MKRSRFTEEQIIAILREQGVNSHKEMAAAFTRAGFEAIDVSMTDLIEDRFHLNDGPSMVQGIADCAVTSKP